ncbi:MAG: Tic22 family protein [Cyanobacteria bacterium P01_H01_bin.15]
MFKTVLGWCATASILGGTVGGLVAGPVPSVIALTEEQAIEKLADVPVFTISNNEGQPLPLTLDPEGNDTEARPFFFVKYEQASQVRQQLASGNPDISAQTRILPVRLSAVIEVGRQAAANNAESAPYTLFPDGVEVQSAVQLLQAQGQQIENPARIGIPLFYGFVQDGENTILLPLVNEDTQESFIPFFMKEDMAQELVTRYKDSGVEKSAEAQIGIIPMAALIQQFIDDQQQVYERIQIIPPPESLQDVQRINQENPPPAGP